MSEQIVILDFGSQYTQVIARRVRECNVYSTIVRYDTPADEIAAMAPRGLILSGGPSSVYAEDAPLPDKAIFKLGVPILGICYGVQLMAHQLGGRVGPSARREYGPADIAVRADGSPLLDGVGDAGGTARVWMSHGDSIVEAPPGFAALATTDSTPFAALADPSRGLWGI